MIALKIVLWLTGIVCLVSVVGIFLPPESWDSIVGYFGVEPLPDLPVVRYMINLMCATYGGVGIYFLILGLSPLKHGILVPFSGLAAVLLGALCIIIGNQVGMPQKWYLSDGLSSLVLGVLILLTWRWAKKAASKSA